jgi:hypothetical protein
MKAFTKWWNTPVKIEELKKEFEANLTRKSSLHDNIAALVWRAALEWALNENDGIGCDPDKLEQELLGN